MKIYSAILIGTLAVTLCAALPQYQQPSNNNRRPNHSSGNNNGRRPNHSSGNNNNNNRRPNNQAQQNLPEGCRIEYITASEIIEVESIEKECRTRNERKCDTKYRNKCTPYTDKECHTEYIDHCETKYEKKCQQLYRDVEEYVDVDDCKNGWITKCEKHWVQYSEGKKWEEDPTRCDRYPNTDCQVRKQQRTKKEPYTDCKNEPYQDCNKRPEEKCSNVVKQNCEDVPYQDCRNVPHQECKDKHTKKPQSVRKQRPVRVCDDGQGGYTRDNIDDNDVAIIDVRNEDDVIQVEEPKPRVGSSDGIVFSE